MAARRIAKSSINWQQLADLCPSNQKANLAAFKSKSDGYLRRVLANPESAPKLNWDVYKKQVPIAGMVEEFRKQYESLKIPYPVNTVSDKLNQLEKEVESDIQAYVTKSKQIVEEFKADIAKINAQIPFDQMTMEEFAEQYPDQAIDALNRPTFWPHRIEDQPTTDPYFANKVKEAEVDAKH